MERIPDSVVIDENRHQSHLEDLDRLAARIDACAEGLQQKGERFYPFEITLMLDALDESVSILETVGKLLESGEDHRVGPYLRIYFEEYARLYALRHAEDIVELEDCDD